MKDLFQFSDRVLGLPPYIFSEINAIKADAKKKGIALLSLGIGDPDEPTPKAIIEKLKEATDRQGNHVYSPYEGTLEFRKSVAVWFQERFQVALDPESEVLALIGSKEGIAHFPQAFCNLGDKCFYPNPGYPIFSTSIQLAGGTPIGVPHRAENGFVPDIHELEKMIVEHRPKFMLFNFPCNPTSATVSLELMTEIVRLARKYETIIVSDNAYSEIYYDEKEKPRSFLEVEGAKEVVIEFHSLSKTFNMTGWRIAYAVGNAKLIAGLLKIKTNVDSGPLLAVQEASAFALKNAKQFTDPIRALYTKRKEILLKGLSSIGIEYFEPKATFFLWAKVPGGKSSMEFTKTLIAKEGLVVTPGIGFGEYGEGFFRLSMTVPEVSLLDAIQRLKRACH